MSNEELYNAIVQHPLFQGLEEEDLQCLVKVARIRVYSRNGLVFDMRHRKTRHFFIVLEGKLQLHLQNLNKKVMEQGEVFGEVAFFSNEHRTGSVVALEKSKLLAFPRSAFMGTGGLSAKGRAEVLRRLANQIISYLTNYLQRSSAMLVQQPEGVNLEFKASYNGKKGQKKTLVRTVAAMLNSDGGSILFGVDNSGEVLGLERYKDNEKMDEAVRALFQFIDSRLGRDCCDLVDIYGDEINGKTVLRVDCSQSKVPIFTPVEVSKTKKKDKASIEPEYVFYRRTGPSNTKLKSRDMVPYLKRRFFQAAV